MTNNNTLSESQAVYYAMPTMAIFFLYGPIFVLQGIYSKYFGLALTTIAIVVFFANIFDAITDPIVGYLSDRYYRRTGSRKSFIVGGGVLCLVSSYFLYVPVTTVTASSFFYYYIAFYLGLKIFDIPHMAWPNELVGCPRVRTKLFSLRSFMMFFGSLLFYSIPQLPYFGETEFTPKTLEVAVIVGAFLLIPTMYGCVKWVPNSVRASPFGKNTHPPYVYLPKIIFLNKPLLIFLLAVLFSGTGLGMWAALSFIYIDSYLNLGDEFSIIYVISIVFSMLALGAWYKFSNYFGRELTWAIGILFILTGILGMSILDPGENSVLPLLIMIVMVYIGIASNNIMMPALLSNIVDYGIWKYGDDHAATFFSILTMVTKINLAIANVVGLGVAGWYGYNPADALHTTENIRGLQLAIFWLPIIILGLSIAPILLFPVNSRRHTIIRKRLDARSIYSIEKSLAKTQ